MSLRHIEEEESEFFTTVEQAGLDMTELGTQMQAFEASMMAAQARE